MDSWNGMGKMEGKIVNKVVPFTGERGKGKGIRVKKTLLISDMGIYRLWSKVRKKFRQEEIKLWIY